MIEWLQSNLATIIVLAIIVVLVVLVLIKMVKDKRAGKGFCSCGCEGCSMKNSCNKNKDA